jgi:hypothetical protein
MPLRINVGLSRKISENYNSVGASINVEAELDQALLARPRELQDEIERLYEQAEASLERQANGKQNRQRHESRSNGNGHSGNGRRNGSITASQRRAIEAIGRRLGLDVDAECRDELGANLDELDVRSASKLIDHLKALQASGNGNGGRR